MSVVRISSGSPYEEKVGYSRAIVADGWVFVAGTTGVDQSTGELVEGVVAQCAKALEIIEKALTEAGSSLNDVVRVTYYLPDRSDFEPCWPLLRQAFGQARPAATMVQAELIDPEMKIEIEVTARIPNG